MKLTTILSLLASQAAASPTTEAAPADDLSTCTSITGDGTFPFVMWSCCQVPGKGSQRTRLDLSQCLKSDKGTLAPEWGGHASGSCHGCRFEGPAFGCYCDAKGFEGGKWSAIPLVGFFLFFSHLDCSFFLLLSFLPCPHQVFVISPLASNNNNSREPSSGVLRGDARQTGKDGR